MIGFQPVTLSWKGQDFTVPAENQLALISTIEDALGGGNAINALMQSGGPSYVRLSRAYGAALRHAGAAVTDEEIYLAIMAGLADQDVEVVAEVQKHVLNLLAIVAPPVAMALRGDTEKKTTAKKSRKGS